MKAFKFIKRIKEGLLLSAVISFMLSVYAPIELFLASQDDFWFSMKTLTFASVLMFLLVFIFLALVFFLLRLFGKLPYNIGLSVSAAGLFVLYVQGNFLVSGIPSLDGTNIDWNAHPEERIKSIVLCVLALSVFVFLLIKLKRKTFKKIIFFSSMAMGFILAVTLATLCLTTPIYEKENDLIATGYNDLTFSKEQNFIMLIVDATESARFREAVANNEEFGDTFDDFVCYDDTAATYPFTLNALPSLLSGVWNENTTSHRDYITRAINGSPLINHLRESNFKIGLYNTGEIVLPKSFDGVFENQINAEPQFSSAISAAVTIIKMAAIRYAPWDLKWYGYNLVTHLADSKALEGATPVKKGNSDFYKALKKENSITVNDGKSARIIHIEGSHVPFQYDKNVNYFKDATYMDNVECTVTICDEFLKQLKAGGVYDNSVIVICGDHGFDDTNDLGVQARANPILLVKGIGDKKDAMTVNSTPVSYEHLAEALTKLIKGETTANTAFDGYAYPNGRRFLKYYFTKEEHMEEYIISGRADEYDKIKPSGKVYDYNG
ncbi:MAG: hypothetical protein J6V50_02885 [Clostridia bacterium]|nr:hypothetical protein [Clostridia bacterium]